MPVLFLFFASVGGLAYFGFIGLFLGPVLLGIAIAAFKIYRDNHQTPASLLVTPEAGGHGLARTFLPDSPQQ